VGDTDHSAVDSARALDQRCVRPCARRRQEAQNEQQSLHADVSLATNHADFNSN
jgi:hypothetical protein